jgi:hypothetical protein
MLTKPSLQDSPLVIMALEQCEAILQLVGMTHVVPPEEPLQGNTVAARAAEARRVAKIKKPVHFSGSIHGPNLDSWLAEFACYVFDCGETERKPQVSMLYTLLAGTPQNNLLTMLRQWATQQPPIEPTLMQCCVFLRGATNPQLESGALLELATNLTLKCTERAEDLHLRLIGHLQQYKRAREGNRMPDTNQIRRYFLKALPEDVSVLVQCNVSEDATIEQVVSATNRILIQYRAQTKSRQEASKSDSPLVSQALFSSTNPPLSHNRTNPLQPFTAPSPLANPYLAHMHTSSTNGHNPYHLQPQTPFPHFAHSPPASSQDMHEQEKTRAYCMHVLTQAGVDQQKIASLLTTPVQNEMNYTANLSVGRRSQSKNECQNSGENNTHTSPAFLSRISRNADLTENCLGYRETHDDRHEACSPNSNMLGRGSQSFGTSQNSGSDEGFQANAFLQRISRNVEQTIENTLHSSRRNCHKCNSPDHLVAHCPDHGRGTNTERCSRCLCLGHGRSACLTNMNAPHNKKRLRDNHERDEMRNRQEHKRKRVRFDEGGSQRKY